MNIYNTLIHAMGPVKMCLYGWLIYSNWYEIEKECLNNSRYKLHNPVTWSPVWINFLYDDVKLSNVMYRVKVSGFLRLCSVINSLHWKTATSPYLRGNHDVNGKCVNITLENSIFSLIFPLLLRTLQSCFDCVYSQEFSIQLGKSIKFWLEY